MTFKKLAVSIGVITALGGAVQSASAQEYEFDFSSNLLSFITFLGDPSRTIAFPNMGKYDFTVTHSTDGTINGFQGSINTSGFNVGAITTMGSLQMAPVTGTGVFSIDDGSNLLTADLTFTEILTVSTSVGVSYGTSVNLSNFSYSGSVAGLQRVANSGVTSDPLSPTLSISAQFVPPRTLTQLMAQGSERSTSYSGSFFSAAPIPEPSTYAMLAVGLGMVGFSLARSRRS